jgi:hypothetical protein
VIGNIKAAKRSLHGLALGDAFGETWFFRPAGEIDQLISERRVPPGPWKWTDDTAMALSLYRMLHDRGEDGSCRLCHKQRSYYAHRMGARTGNVSLAEASRDGQQLFFAGMWNPNRGHGKQPYVKTTMPADMTLLRPASYRQLVLLDLPRDLQAGLRNGFPPPPDPALEAAFHQFVRDYATARGWKRTKTEHVHRAVRIMLGIQDTPGAAIRRSDVALLSRIKYSAAVAADVLAAAGMLEGAVALSHCAPAAPQNLHDGARSRRQRGPRTVGLPRHSVGFVTISQKRPSARVGSCRSFSGR